MKNFDVTDEKYGYFLKNNANRDSSSLYLEFSGKDLGFPLDLAVTQIECRKKAARKLSRFLTDTRFMFPSVLAAEQATHQCVAAYHAMIAGKGKQIADLTAGLGIDAFTLAMAGNCVTALELDPERFEALQHNASVLNLSDFEAVEGDCFVWLKGLGCKGHYDIIFADPARRGDENKRLYFLRDTLPDVVSNYGLLRENARTIMVKASPIVDIKSILEDIPDTSEIHIVCIKGECKEVLVIANTSDSSANKTEDTANETTQIIDEPMNDALIKVVDLDDDPNGNVKLLSHFKTSVSELGNANAPIADMSDIMKGSYLYDPVSGLHKLNCGNAICRRYPGMKRVAPNTDFYLSTTLFPDFCGRIFRIEGIAGKKDLKEMKGKRYEIISRNYPLKADELRQKLKLKSSDTDFLLACRATPNHTPAIIKCKRIIS